MTTDRSVQERISQWLVEEAPSQLPDRVLQATFERTRPVAQRPSPPWWRSFRMSRTIGAIAVGAAAIALVALGVVLQPRHETVGPNPSPTTTVPPSLAAVATPPSSDGQVAIVRTIDGNSDLFLMAGDGTGARRLTTDPAEDLEPIWLADGQSLVFTRRTALEPERSEIYAIDIASGRETPLTHTGARAADPRLSPDGLQLAYEATPPGIYIMKTDGSGQHEVFTFDGYYTLLTWSLDGRSLYLRREADQVLLRLDVKTGDVLEASPEPGLAGQVSPDGTLIAFEDASRGRGLWVMARDGSGARHVFGEWTRPYAFAWAPDGEHLFFAQGDGWLYVIGTDGSGLARWAEGLASAPRP